MSYPGIYRAKAIKLTGSVLTAYVPQVFGDVQITVENFVGTPPSTDTMGWVAFQGGMAEFPVWIEAGMDSAALAQALAAASFVKIPGDTMTGPLAIDTTTNVANLETDKTGASNFDGAIHMRINSAGTTIGRITRATSSTAGFLTTSDEDLKENLVAVNDDMAMLWMRTIEPYFFNYKTVPDVRHVGYSAQRVANQWPNGISNGIIFRGHGDVNQRTWDTNGNETTPPEVWEAWMMDHSKITPILHSALQALDRIQVHHEERITALEEGGGGGGTVTPRKISFVHYQNTPASRWLIDHNLGWYPNAMVLDSAGDVAEGDIDQLSIDQLALNFSAGFSGTAYLS